MLLLKILVFLVILWLIFRLIFRLLFYHYVKKSFNQFQNDQKQRTKQPEVTIHLKNDDNSAESAEFEELN